MGLIQTKKKVGKKTNQKIRKTEELPCEVKLKNYHGYLA